MPKRTKYPGLRRHSWVTAGGEVRTAYYLDQRGIGKDIPLGTDFDEAVRQWHSLKHDRPRIAGTLKEAFDRWEAEALPESKATARDYLLCLAQLRPVMQHARWDDIDLPSLKGYLKARTAKTRANRELSVLQVVWNWARLEGLHKHEWPAAGMERSKWKNAEGRRRVVWTQPMIDAICKHAEPALLDTIELMSATGMRVRDAIKCRLTDVRGGALVFTASKTSKEGEFPLAESPALRELLKRRKASKAPHIMLLTRGNVPVTERWLMDAWARARAKALPECPEVAGVILRDVRKLAAQLAGSLGDAQDLLQHGSRSTTQRSYRPIERLRPVR